MSWPPDASNVKREKACGVARKCERAVAASSSSAAPSAAPPSSTNPELLLCLMYLPSSIARSTQKSMRSPPRVTSMTKACRKSTFLGGPSLLYRRAYILLTICIWMSEK